MTRRGAAVVGAAVAAVLIVGLALGQAGRAWAAEIIVASLSQHDVSLTTGFSGSELLVYGAVREGHSGSGTAGCMACR